MTALSIRIDPDLERRLDLEVARLNTTRSRFVQELLREALAPKNPVLLLEEARATYRLPDPAKAAKLTDRSTRVKEAVRDAVKRKRAAGKGAAE